MLPVVVVSRLHAKRSCLIWLSCKYNLEGILKLSPKGDREVNAGKSAGAE